MYTFLIVLILIASVLMVLAVLVQNPKSGMASNFGASNQVMGVRQTADFLEKFTWGAAVVVLVLSLLSTVFIDGAKSTSTKADDAHKVLTEQAESAEITVPQVDATAADTAEAPATEAPAAEATEAPAK